MQCCRAYHLQGSLHRKHLLKHVKNYRCTYPGCKRQTGFGTQNDLDRHEKSVHHIGVANTKNYRCAARNCAKATKLWPRLDNFKSHLTRMHPDEDMNLLLAKYGSASYVEQKY